MRLEDAEKLAEQIVDQIRPFCERVELLGAYGVRKVHACMQLL